MGTIREMMETKFQDGRLSRKGEGRTRGPKIQVGSLASRIDGNHEYMKAILDACLEEIEESP